MEELQNDGFTFTPLFRARMIVENADLAAIQEWFWERGVDSMYAPSLCAVTEAEETFHVHPSYFRLSESEALLYQYIMAKHDFLTLDIDVRKLDGAVWSFVQKEEQNFCKENGIYGNYSWDEHASPFLSSGAARLQAVLKVKILNAKGFKRVKDGKIDYAKDIRISRFVYVRKEETKKKSLEEKIEMANAHRLNSIGSKEDLKEAER